MKCTVSGFVDIAISELEKCAELHCNKGTRMFTVDMLIFILHTHHTVL